MKSRLIATGIAILGFAIIDGKAANAATYIWDEGGGSTTWTDAANWDVGTNYPGFAANDVAIVPSTATYQPVLNVHLDGTGGRFCIASLNIQDDAIVKTGAFRMHICGNGSSAATRLAIDDATGGTLYGILRVEAGGEVHLIGGGEHFNNGEIRLETSTSTLSIVDNNAILSSSATPKGFVTGQDDAAEIDIDTVTLTSTDVTIRGHMNITGTGTFINGGRVEANNTAAADELLIDVGTLDDTADINRWVVSTHENAHLRLNPTTQNPMEGEFVVSNGTLEIDTALTTTHGQ